MPLLMMVWLFLPPKLAEFYLRGLFELVSFVDE